MKEFVYGQIDSFIIINLFWTVVRRIRFVNERIYQLGVYTAMLCWVRGSSAVRGNS